MKQTKVCTACKETKPLSEFYADKRQRDGHYSSCKACVRAARQEARGAKGSLARERYNEAQRLGTLGRRYTAR